MCCVGAATEKLCPQKYETVMKTITSGINPVVFYYSVIITDRNKYSKTCMPMWQLWIMWLVGGDPNEFRVHRVLVADVSAILLFPGRLSFDNHSVSTQRRLQYDGVVVMSIVVDRKKAI